MQPLPSRKTTLIMRQREKQTEKTETMIIKNKQIVG